MIADTLLNWDKAELANILANKVADADDLIEAIPSIEKPGAMEESVLDDYIQSNWKIILSCFDVEELTAWIDEKDYEAEWEQWKNECVEQEEEYAECMNDLYYMSIVELMYSFMTLDLVERWGYMSKFRKS